MAYTIEYSPATLDHLDALTARQRATIFAAVDAQLAHEPSVETVEPGQDRQGGLRAMTIRRVDVADATESLATYIRKAAGSGPVVVTDAGQPVAALVMLKDTNLETVALSTDPDFLELVQSSRARHSQEGGLSSAEVRRRLESERSTPRRPR